MTMWGPFFENQEKGFLFLPLTVSLLPIPGGCYLLCNATRPWAQQYCEVNAEPQKQGVGVWGGGEHAHETTMAHTGAGGGCSGGTWDWVGGERGAWNWVGGWWGSLRLGGWGGQSETRWK